MPHIRIKSSVNPEKNISSVPLLSFAIEGFTLSLQDLLQSFFYPPFNLAYA